jgi:hypothetical protein
MLGIGPILDTEREIANRDIVADRRVENPMPLEFIQPEELSTPDRRIRILDLCDGTQIFYESGFEEQLVRERTHRVAQ